MKILSYGALLIENKNLRKQIEKLQLVADFLRSETIVQSRVIGQFRQLHKSLANPLIRPQNVVKFCDRGHFGCKILHSRFSLVNKSADAAEVKTVHAV